MKVLIVIALCITIALAVPVENGSDNDSGNNEEVQFTLTDDVDAEPTIDDANNDLTRDKRHYG
jgi:predicted secreted protein